jgi:hypothetical protein
MLISFLSMSAHALDRSQAVASCKKELAKSNFYFSATKGAECMDLFFMSPELNEPSGSFNFVSAFGEKILVKQPDNLSMYSTVFFIYYSQWRMAVEVGGEFSIYINRLNEGLRLFEIAERRIGQTEAFLKEKSSSLYPIAIFYIPELRNEVMNLFKKLDAITSNISTKIRARNSIARIHETNKKYQKAIDVLKTILDLVPNRPATIKKIKLLEEKLNTP